MRTRALGVGIGLCALSALTGARDARAQTAVDAFPPLPNVLLLVDTSGSMEYDVGGNLPGPGTCTGVVGDSYKSRWISLIEVLTGNISNYGCFAHDREDGDFINEFDLAGVSPYDQGYFLPYHRALSNGCMFTPGAIDTNNMLGWEANPFSTRQYGAPLGTACGSPFDQARDGILDTYRDRVRFGLFTFDARPDAGVGLSGGTNLDAATGFEGHWSYFPDWWTGGGTPATGHPPDCLIPNQIHEVGARNAAAPPWEGRMVNFGPVYATLQETRDHNDRVQNTLLALRPYGATPLNGMLEDARYFFRSDDMNDGYYTIVNGFAADEKFAPAQDPLLNNPLPTGNCREGFIIVLSDGEPNLDMRPYCEQLAAMGGPDGDCPYDDLPHEIVADLYNGYPRIRTFAIGFGLSMTGSGLDCTTLDGTSFAPGQPCEAPVDPEEIACCNLARIADAGGTSTAFFADNVPNLKAAIAAVLDSIATTSTTRTVPTFVTAQSQVASNAEATAYEFASAFTPQPGQLWRGNIERKRWVCDNVAPDPELEAVDDVVGDDFATNMHSGAGPQRRFFTAIPVANGGTGLSEPTYSLRPNSNTFNDGVGTYGSGGTLTGTALQDAAALALTARGQPSAFNADPTLPVECQGPDLIAANGPDCAEALMLWNLGAVNGGLPNRATNQLGAVYHSIPRVIGRPQALTSDAAYALFQRNDAVKPSGPRPIVLYAQTVDGQLHAFKVATNEPADANKVDNADNNEIWSFLPPHALKGIHSMYPNTPQILSDGPIAVRDIPFERTSAEALDSNAQYRTVLVASGGIGGGYYYALDVTDPYDPEFLWQLSRDEDGNRMFSSIAAGEPSIALVGIDEGGTRREVAVAILPGGEGQQGAVGGCARQNGNFQHIDDTTVPPYKPRANVRCWQAGASRSVTIVSLEDGEVLRAFYADPADAPPGLVAQSLVTNADLDAPLLGAVAFPNGTGQVANRAYLNDQDGSVWRLDLSDPDPANWKLELFFDAYSGEGPDDGQPITNLPVMSLDEQGNTIVLFSTGDQEEFRSTTTKNRVFSVTEFPLAAMNGALFQVESNWRIVEGANVSVTGEDFKPGEKVTGPIAVFNEVAYFSTLTPPPATDACTVGEGTIWAVKFLTDLPNKRPEPGVPGGTDYKFTLPDNVNPFGVAVTAEPPCRDESTITDDYVGRHRIASTTQRANYVLRFFTGKEGAADAGSSVNIASIDLPEPDALVTIDSWASIVE